MVNTLKREVNLVDGGPFYINEYLHVLVPTTNGYWFAGSYVPRLKFRYNSEVISPCAPDSLKPGDPWPGPHVGISYVLTAGANDLKYRIVEGNVEHTRTLSTDIGVGPAKQLANRLARVKGDNGGAIYINEARSFFAPVLRANKYTYLYLGPLGKDAWFKDPTV
jgi:hypothetical protein